MESINTYFKSSQDDAFRMVLAFPVTCCFNFQGSCQVLKKLKKVTSQVQQNCKLKEPSKCLRMYTELRHHMYEHIVKKNQRHTTNEKPNMY